MHGTERMRNVSRTILAHLSSLSFTPDTDIVPIDDTAYNSQTNTQFVRVAIRTLGGVPNGIRSGRKTQQYRLQVIAECYARAPGANAIGAIDAAERVADTVADGMRNADITLRDYVLDTTGATATTQVLRFIDPPEIASPPPVDGWGRRIVSATGLWWAEHKD